MGLLSGIGRVVSNVGQSKGAMIGLMGGAAAIGGISTVASSAVDASMDVAFGAPDADKYFVGRELNTRYLLGRGIGGFAGTMMQATDPAAAMTFSGGRNIPGGKTTMIGGAVGAAGGSIGGAALAGAFGGGVKARIGGAIAGAVIGGGAMASMPMANAGMTIRNNQAFFSESAYGRNSSSSTAAGLGAVGDIVLGMHNSRGGF